MARKEARTHTLRALVAGLGFFALVSSHSLTANDDREHKLKAAYLINLTGFISWADDSEETRVCIAPNSQVAPYVLAQSGRRLAGDRTLITLTEWDDLGECDMLYWDELPDPWSDGEELAKFPGLLTISDQRGALDQGYTIQFYMRNLKLRFAVNNEMVKDAHFRISSKLLRLSRQVD